MNDIWFCYLVDDSLDYYQWKLILKRYFQRLHQIEQSYCCSPSCIKVEIFLEQREVAFLSPSKICENLNFSTEIQIFANFVGW